jgi:hypothetical protein
MKPSGPGQSSQLLLHSVGFLVDMKIPYVVVGALAVSFHGVPRSTNDADAAIWLSGTGKTESDLVVRIEADGLQVAVRHGDAEDPVSGVVVIKDQYQNTIDLILGVRGLDADAANRAITAPLLGSAVNIMAAEDLIPMKLFAGGVRDLADVKGILQVSGQQLDMDLTRKLARRYGAEVEQKLNQLIA